MVEREEPQLSVVIPCLNAEGFIARQLEALARQEWSEPWEVIVADNGSTDGTLAVVESFRGRLPDLRVVDASAQPGQAFAMNAGAQAARGESVAFCDADDEVAPGWVAAMGEALAEHEFVCARMDHEKLNEPWVRETREPMFAGGLPTIWFPPYRAYGASGALGVRRRLHELVGGFDESAFLQDLEYSLRVQERGAELVFVPKAVIHYRYRDRLWPIFRQAFGYGEALAAVERRYSRDHRPKPGLLRWLTSGWKPALGVIAALHRRGSRGRLAWILGWQLGRYRGSIRHRVRTL